MDQFEAEPILGAVNAIFPFLSPDGDWIGYLDYEASKLKKVWLHGGALVDICPTGRYVAGASWGADDTIVFSRDHFDGLSRISASGGAPEVVTSPDRQKGEKTHRFPEVLPGGKSVLFMVGTSNISSYADATLAVVSLEAGEQKVVVEGGHHPHYLPTGHIVYARSGSLLAVPFDLERLEVTGVPVKILDGVVTSSPVGHAHFSYSQDGTLVYVPGGPDIYNTKLVEVDGKGDHHPIPLAPRALQGARYSPDGKSLVLEVAGANDQL